MKSIFIYCIAMLCTFNIYAQHTFKAIIKDKNNQPLQETTASINVLNKSAIADSNGVVVITNIPFGKFDISFSCVGFDEQTISVDLLLAKDSILKIEMKEDVCCV